MIRLRLSPATIDQVVVAYSPLGECVLSLRVLKRATRHPLHQPWARAMRRLPPSLLETLDCFAFAIRDNAGAFFATNTYAPEPFAAELALLRSLPPSAVRHQLTWGLHRGGLSEADLERTSVRRRLMDAAARDSAPGQRELELVLEQPETFLAAFSELIAAYFEQAFASEWERIEPLLAASAAEAQRRIGAGLYEALPHLSPRLRGDARRRQILIEDTDDGDASLTPGETLVLAPSIYAWPELTVCFEQGPWPKRIIYPTPLLAAWSLEPPPPAELQQLLRALSNHTRLSALRLIAEKPRTTQELAPLIGISEATLSRHLHLLTEVGALIRCRQGRFVLYALEQERLAQLEPGLFRYLHSQSGVTR